MGKRLAIKGHLTRGKEVIEILEMLGGKSAIHGGAILDKCVYPIIEGVILELPQYKFNDFVVFTLEEFLEKYPFKVGDKVEVCETGKVFTIGNMIWEDELYTIHYCNMEDIEYYTAKELKLYKETNMNENKFPSFEPLFKMNDEIEYKIPDGYEITEVSKDKVFIKPIKPKYPKTYKECCDVLLIPPYYNLRYHTYEPRYDEYATSNTLLSLEDKLNTLGKLIICRDAYWKIAGEEMGLDKPWKPDFGKDTNYYIFYYMYNKNYQICRSNCNNCNNKILAFPSEDIADEFYENFKDLIEQCKKFL